MHSGEKNLDRDQGGLSGKPDADLVRSAQKGLRADFDELVRRYIGLVHTIAYSHLKQHEAAEDLTQEVFLRVCLHLDKIQDPDRFNAWISGITRNLARDWLRQNKRRSELVPMVSIEENNSDVPETKTPDARERLVEAQEKDALHMAIMDLPEDEREVVLLHYAEDMSQAEIARRTGLHPSTVMRRLDRAVELLQGSIEPAIRQCASGLGARPDLAKRTMLLAGTAAALSVSAKTALADAAVLPTLSGTATAAAAGGGFLLEIPGGAFLSTIGGKIAAGVCALLALGTGVVAVQQVAIHQGPQEPILSGLVYEWQDTKSMNEHGPFLLCRFTIKNNSETELLLPDAPFVPLNRVRVEWDGKLYQPFQPFDQFAHSLVLAPGQRAELRLRMRPVDLWHNEKAYLLFPMPPGKHKLRVEVDLFSATGADLRTARSKVVIVNVESPRKELSRFNYD